MGCPRRLVKRAEQGLLSTGLPFLRMTTAFRLERRASNRIGAGEYGLQTGSRASREDGMEPGDVVNLGTAVLALAALIVLFRMFRGDLGDNKGGMAFAVVILGGLAYFVRTNMGRGLVDYLLAILQ